MGMNPSTRGNLVERNLDTGEVEVRKWSSFFVYPMTIGFTSANQRETVVIPMQNDADFELFELVGSQLGSYELNIQDASSNRYLFADPVTSDNIIGSPERPFYLPNSVVFAKNGSIVFELKNGATALNPVELLLIGAKIFKFGGQQPGL